jgi:hypothetical protein
MTWAIFSIVASDLSPSGCSAYTYHQTAYDPYMRAPFFQLSEQMVDNATTNGGTHPAYPFLTGHGGANQVVLFGYLGLRLLPDDILHIDPNPPPQLPHIQYRTFYWRGWPIAARSNATHTTLARADLDPLDTADMRFANASIAVHVGFETNGTSEASYELPATGELTVPNGRIGWIPTTDGNMAQCLPVASRDAYAPGQFPIAVVDGATSTRWQPASSKISAVTVDLGRGAAVAGANVTAFHFDWAAMPPVNATVVFHDVPLRDPAAVAAGAHEGGDYRVVATLTDIAQSKPYRADSEEFTAVAVPVGNTTDVRLDAPVQAARYATLLISGNQGLAAGDEDVGATVAEWAIISPAMQTHAQQRRSGRARSDMLDRTMLRGRIGK